MIHRRILTIAVAVFALAFAASPALAAKAPHRYSPRHGAKCRKGYKRSVKHQGAQKRRRIFCVKRAAKKRRAPAPLAKTNLHAHLDPSFTRDPADPFKVTYAFSASATQETFSAQDVRLGEESASLPAGVLALYSDGKLECAINVGGSTTGSECPVSYATLGSHSVTTIYTSGEESATETETEQIEPLATTTTLEIAYADLEGSPNPIKTYAYCTGSEHLNSEACTYEYEWELGTLTETASSDPAGAVNVTCSAPSCPTGLTGSLDGSRAIPVILKARGEAEGEYEQVPNSPTCEQVKASATSGGSSSNRWSYPTTVGLSAVQSAKGYAGAPATVSVEWEPTLPC